MLMQCLRKLRPRYNAQYFGLRRNYRSIETKITKFIIIVIIISVIYYPHYRCPRYPINRQFYRRTRRSTTKSSFSRRVKLTNDLKSNASSTEEDALPSSSSRTPFLSQVWTNVRQQIISSRVVREGTGSEAVSS